MSRLFVFSPVSIRFLGLILRSLIHFELIFVESERGVQFILLYVDTISSAPFHEEAAFAQRQVWGTFVDHRWLQLHGLRVPSSISVCLVFLLVSTPLLWDII